MRRPHVQLVGELDHPEFSDAVAELRETAELVESSAELILVAQSRPGSVAAREVEGLRRRTPLAGAVALLGTWCEGEMRSGRPWAGVERIYWYEFAGWWRQQLTLCHDGRCPDWARPVVPGLRYSEASIRGGGPVPLGLVVVRSGNRGLADAVCDVLREAGYATAWQRPGERKPVLRGAALGVWVGGQLDDGEAVDLAAFCRDMAQDGAAVLAMLDFPRRDRAFRAKELGVHAVSAMPWVNGELLSVVGMLSGSRSRACAA